MGALTEVERDSGVVVRLAVSDEVNLVLPLLLLQAVFGAAVVTHAAAAQDEDDRPNHPKPCETQNSHITSFSNKSNKKRKEKKRKMTGDQQCALQRPRKRMYQLTNAVLRIKNQICLHH